MIPRIGVFRLLSEASGCVDQEPARSIAGKAGLELHAEGRDLRAAPGKITEWAGAIPLGNATTGGTPQQFEFHQGLDFGGGVAVDLAAEAYFFKIRAGPDFCFHD